MLLIGPPGTGKTMLAARLPGLMPPMSDAEALEAAAVQSLGGVFAPGHWRTRPFRSPHHTTSGVALVGGGTYPRPGEISLAHCGVLFLDELPEFDRRVLEVLRQPLESGTISISRAAGRASYPARFQLVAAMNPCPCGFLGHPSGKCRCTRESVLRYQGRLSGPLLDRFDMLVDVAVVKPEEMSGPADGDTSAMLAQRVAAAFARQHARQGKTNQGLGTREIDRHCKLDAAGEATLRDTMEQLHWSGRAYHRVLKVARSIADLAGDAHISADQVREAIQYRRGLREP